MKLKIKNNLKKIVLRRIFLSLPLMNSTGQQEKKRTRNKKLT